MNEQAKEKKTSTLTQEQLDQAWAGFKDSHPDLLEALAKSAFESYLNTTNAKRGLDAGAATERLVGKLTEVPKTSEGRIKAEFLAEGMYIALLALKKEVITNEQMPQASKAFAIELRDAVKAGNEAVVAELRSRAAEGRALLRG